MPHWCRKKRIRHKEALFGNQIFWKVSQALPVELTSPQAPAAPALSSSSAGRRYAPQASVKTEVPTTIGSNSSVPSRSTNASQQGGLGISHQDIRITPDSTSEPVKFVLFGIQGSRRTLEPGQIRTHRQSTDSSVFQDLKECYRTHRGRLRLWFSIWRLENCEIVKVGLDTEPAFQSLMRISVR